MWVFRPNSKVDSSERVAKMSSNSVKINYISTTLYSSNISLLLLIIFKLVLIFSEKNEAKGTWFIDIYFSEL